jgi:SAM-dependent methyltransferase
MAFSVIAETGAGRGVACPCCGCGEAREFLKARDLYNGRLEVYQLLRCRKCSFAWVKNPPEPEEMAWHYAGSYHTAISTGGEKAAARRWAPHRKLLYRYKQGGAILDAGCSSGAFLGVLDARAWQRFGIEMAPEMAKRAEQLTGARVFAGDILDAKFGPQSFDAITSLHSLEHVYAPREVLLKFFEWLKPEGILYIAVPNIDAWEARLFGAYWYALEAPRHLSYFSKRSLEAMVTAAGFTRVRICTPASSYIEPSLTHVLVAVAERCGKHKKPLAAATEPSLPFKIVRKAFRSTLLEAFRQISGWAGKSAEIHAIFRKPQ